MINIDAIPAELRDGRFWVCWRYDPPDKPGDEPKKVPYDPRTARKAKWVRTRRITAGSSTSWMRFILPWQASANGVL